ncbi:uncharacterized mitochondrial protein-like protein [Tanacetum coccineum]
MDKSESYLAAPEHRECYEGLIKLYDLDKTLFSTYDKVYSLKRSQKDKDKDEDPSVGSDRGLKKRKTSKDAELTKGPKAKESQSGSSKGTKSQPKSSRKSVQSEEPEFEVADSDMPQDQEGNLGNDDDEPIKETTPQQGPTQSWLMTLAFSADKPSKTFNELMSTPIDFSAYIMNGLKITNLTQETLMLQDLSEKLDWENPEGGNYPFDLTKPLPLVMSGNHQKVPVDYFFNNDLKYLQGGVSTMTYTTSITKTKAAQYDLLGIEDVVPNIWVPIKVAYDKHALWGISHWREQRKTFYGYARGLESRHDVYSTKCILSITQVEVMRKHGYGYLKEIVIRRADNDLYRFMEGDFLRLHINDIEDMLLLIVQNRLTNLSSSDVSDFAIALRMFTWLFRSESKIFNSELKVTKRKSTSPSLKLPDPALEKGTHLLYIKTLKDSFMSTTKRETVPAKEKMEYIGKEKSSYHDQGDYQAAEGEKDNEELRKGGRVPNGVREFEKGGYGRAGVETTGCNHAFLVTHGCIRLCYCMSSNARWTPDHIREPKIKRDGKEVYSASERDDGGCPLLKDLEALFVGFEIHFLAEFDYQLEYKPGKANVVADALSRKAKFVAITQAQFFLQDRIKEGLEHDPLAKKIIALAKDRRTQRFWLKEDMLLTKGDRLYVPKWGDLRRAILKECHDSKWDGHPGITRTLALVEGTYYWPRIRDDVETFVQTCLIFQQDKIEQKKSGGLLEPLPTPKGP